MKEVVSISYNPLTLHLEGETDAHGSEARLTVGNWDYQPEGKKRVWETHSFFVDAKSARVIASVFAEIAEEAEKRAAKM